MKRELERVPIADEEAARERTWAVLESAFAERTPTLRASQWPRVAVVAVVLGAVLAAALSPPGRAVIDEIREAVGVQRAQPALFSLPAEGRLLVASDAGIWVVQHDGSKRLLGDYREASWSPFGRFVVAARENELAALEPDGDVRWTLARRGVRSPRWAGTETDTRIAYVDRTGLRIVAGDGTGDRLLLPGFQGTFAWRPDDTFLLAAATRREVRVVETATGRTLWRRTHDRHIGISWSESNGRLLLASAVSLTVYDARGRVVYERAPAGAPVHAAALAPSGRMLAFAQGIDRGLLRIVPRLGRPGGAARRLLGGPGGFGEIVWEPAGQWILVSWGAADQWVFVRPNGAAIRAVSNVSVQFRSRSFPRIEGWCCAAPPR